MCWQWRSENLDSPWENLDSPWKIWIPPWKIWIPPWKIWIPPWKIWTPPWKFWFPPGKFGFPLENLDSPWKKFPLPLHWIKFQILGGEDRVKEKIIDLKYSLFLPRGGDVHSIFRGGDVPQPMLSWFLLVLIDGCNL